MISSPSNSLWCNEESEQQSSNYVHSLNTKSISDGLKCTEVETNIQYNCFPYIYTGRAIPMFPS